MRARRGGSPLSSPVLLGALTVLVTIVAVVLAFQANNGLPFVPRYTLHVQVPNAEELTHGGEVHMGGALVGSVASVDAARDRAGRPIAVLDLALSKTIEPLPVDSRFTIRLKGAIGEKYVDISLGHARRTWRDGATVPASRTAAAVDLDQVLSMFTPRTRAGVAASTVGLSDALAGRGTGLGHAIGAFVPLVSDLTPVMRNLAAPKTDLRGFITGLEALSAALAPVSQSQAQLYENLDTTFQALAPIASPYLQDAISDSPPAFQTVIDDSGPIGRFAKDTATLFTDLRPGVAALTSSAPLLSAVFVTGARTLPETGRLDSELVSLSHSLGSFSTSAPVLTGVRRLTQTAQSLVRPLDFLTPVQSTCNYATLFLRNIASSLSDPIGTGTVLRFVIISASDAPGSEAEPAAGPYLTSSLAAGADQAPLHSNPYPNTASPGQRRECAAGNEPFNAAAAAIGNPAKNVGLRTESTVPAPGKAAKKKAGKNGKGG
jgi:virulence factor Mce-like protein